MLPARPVPPGPPLPGLLLTELLRQCLSGLTQPVPALAAWIERMETRP